MSGKRLLFPDDPQDLSDLSGDQTGFPDDNDNFDQVNSSELLRSASRSDCSRFTVVKVPKLFQIRMRGVPHTADQMKKQVDKCAESL